ncbi:Leucine Rich Repeat domain protein [Aspergillus glaucus CBS 516.65]|uniref:Uncharacterized protein n=1 Tax=Aspergillus glaucus CBS 516.65 TaxID=1160497 RepID=A0A1L9VE95_ASPGL|nr:hypothetical protein ASPGLDRAFT_130769 [Aspergillus glaucus CBS 516.65]OJJ82226.1 hypothetical protein ASPGLDRAFT_130769 [Aspergillus glaucus CBS 516.65]
MSSSAAPSATVASACASHHHKPSFSRFTTAPAGYSATQEGVPHSPRDESPQISNCSSPDGSRSSSRRRDSFGSIKEDVDGVAQSFVDTHIDHPPNEEPAKPNVSEMLQQAPDFCCPCGGFLGWKQIRLGGKSLSRSYSDLRALGSLQTRGWAWETAPALSDARPSFSKELKPPQPQQLQPVQQLEPQETQPPRRTSALERLPPEVLDVIISDLAVDIPPNGFTPRNVDLVCCLLASRTLHAATLGVLYRNMTFPHSIVFSKGLNHLTQYPALGTLVRRLDFSHFTSVGLGRTKQMNAEIQNLTSRTLLQCLNLLPNLRECLLQEHVEGDISIEILQKLFFGLPNMNAIDFCGCSTQSFSTIFLEALTTVSPLPPTLPNLKRLSLHECSSLSAEAFELLLPRLVNVTHLDLTHTLVTEEALLSIPKTARITHLSLSRCTRLRGNTLVHFLTTHPAVRDSLVFLNLLTDATRYRTLDEDHLHALLPKLPSTLRSLNLGGAKVSSEHTRLLLPLTKHLDELGLSSADLTAKDLNTFFAPPSPPPSHLTGEQDDQMAIDQPPAPPASEWVPPSLAYMDLNKVPQLTIGTIFNTNTCLLLSQQSYPLQVIEFGDKIIAPLRERTKNTKSSSGWMIRELGRRGWYVRDPDSMPSRLSDDGSRSWKMGARWWGMRKIPVAVGDVGGIYGHYMFKK